VWTKPTLKCDHYNVLVMWNKVALNLDPLDEILKCDRLLRHYFLMVLLSQYFLIFKLRIFLTFELDRAFLRAKGFNKRNTYVNYVLHKIQNYIITRRCFGRVEWKNFQRSDVQCTVLGDP